MTDYFALLNEPRRPWLDAEALKQKFHAVSGPLHPDRHHASPPADQEAANARFAELNSAYNCLREPKERLRHLLTLETGARPKDLHEMPADLSEMFMRVGALNRQVESFLSERAKANSPLLRVGFFERAQEWSDKLAALQREISARSSTVLEQVRELDGRWLRGGPRAQLLPQLESCWRLLSFFSRWNGQVQDLIVQLNF
ncbi:MAG: hypothetical protein EPO07_07250 [Verrucomicrobia bacterium]|nr:MAG: hypothetical protein EPO07_07250 [Verrucomicrobiota bacterium]